MQSNHLERFPLNMFFKQANTIGMCSVFAWILCTDSELGPRSSKSGPVKYFVFSLSLGFFELFEQLK